MEYCSRILEGDEGRGGLCLTFQKDGPIFKHPGGGVKVSDFWPIAEDSHISTGGDK